MAIASTCGHPSAARRRGSTPGPQSSNSLRPSLSTMYPDWAPPGFGHAGEHPTTVNFTGAIVPEALERVGGKALGQRLEHARLHGGDLLRHPREAPGCEHE